MDYKTRRVVMYSHLNSAGVLFGGQALAWIDEEAVYICCLSDGYHADRHKKDVGDRFC